jgi:hypothetical protein
MNEQYVRQVIPFLKAEYFSGSHSFLFKQVGAFVGKYNALPTKEAFLIELEKSDPRGVDASEVSTLLEVVFSKEEVNQDWLMESTEKWCQDRAIHLAIMESINIIDGKHKELTKNALPDILSAALGVSFDRNVGHDYIDGFQNRYDFYHREEDRLPFDLDYFNKITKGGLPRKTLNIALAGCVHPATKVKIRFRKKMMEIDWVEKEIPISEIQTLLDNGYEVEVDSPDGYVPVNFFINKGMYEEFVLESPTMEFDSIRCNSSHLFETTIGWVSAGELLGKGEVNILTKDGYKKGEVFRTGEEISIVDINVEHENHRYYTNGVSSHNTGVGKSLFMCHCAANSLMEGRNVLYITMEMAEERIAERIDANLMNLPIDKLEDLPLEAFESKVRKIAQKTQGKLIVKEYPTASAHVGHFRALVNELKLKNNFTPDIVFIDYLNICASSRMKMGGTVNTYSLIKSIAEEIRGLAVELNVPIMSATQTTRSGYSNTDVGLEDTSESFGLPATADFMFALISTEELESLGQIMVKQLKNRYNDPGTHKRFVIGVDRAKMKLYDVEESAQSLIQSTPTTGGGSAEIANNTFGNNTRDFSGFKA